MAIKDEEKIDTAITRLRLSGSTQKLCAHLMLSITRLQLRSEKVNGSRVQYLTRWRRPPMQDANHVKLAPEMECRGIHLRDLVRQSLSLLGTTFCINNVNSDSSLQ